jgi:hypothetical protein
LGFALTFPPAPQRGGNKALKRSYRKQRSHVARAILKLVKKNNSLMSSEKQAMLRMQTNCQLKTKTKNVLAV